MTTINEANIKLGSLLAEAEKQGSLLPLLKLQQAGLVPDSLEVGMAAQAIAVGAVGKTVAGWKISIKDDWPLAAPILDLFTLTTDTGFYVPKPGAVGVEAEICFVLSDDIPAPQQGKPYSRQDILDRVASVHMGMELVGYRLVEENNVPTPLFLVDRLGNHSFVLGPQIDAVWLDRLADHDASVPLLELKADDDILFSAVPRHPQNDPLFPLLACANQQIDQLGGFRKGNVVTTGSVCGLLRLSGQSLLKTKWGDIAQMQISVPDKGAKASI